MKALILGSGGREHAIAWKLSKEGWEVVVAPGNGGIAQEFSVLDIPSHDRMKLLEACQAFQPDVIVIGPEDPLIAGIADMFRENGFSTFGPGLDAARLEGSKSFSKDMMKRAGVPSADYHTFSHSGAASEYIRGQFSAGKQVAIKASGAALGKGVVVCSDEDEAIESAVSMLDDGILGDAGRSIVVEQRLFGREFSLLTIVSDQGILSLPVAQDYKQAYDDDLGPNTGGMGTYSPVDWLSSDVVAETEEAVVKPILNLFKGINVGYRGVLFSGLMVTSEGVKCLEYNVRFGDPETQTVLRRVENGFGDCLLAAARGDSLPGLVTSKQAAVTVICASGGYPGGYEKGQPVTIGDLPEGVKVFHSGTSFGGDGGLVTNGGRVLGVSAIGSTLAEARASAYLGVEQVEFEGKMFRTDIGSAAIR